MAKNDIMNVAKTPSAKQYLTRRAVVNSGIPTAIICLPIYYFLKNGPVLYTSVAGDLLLSVLITVLLCALSGIPGIKSELRKGKAPKMPLSKQQHPVYSRISNGYVMQCLQFALLATAIFALLPGGLLAAIATMSGNPQMAFSEDFYWVAKSIYSGVFITFSMKWITYSTIAQHYPALGTLSY